MFLGGDGSAYKRRKPLVSTAVPSKIKAIMGFIIDWFLVDLRLFLVEEAVLIVPSTTIIEEGFNGRVAAFIPCSLIVGGRTIKGLRP